MGRVLLGRWKMLEMDGGESCTAMCMDFCCRMVHLKTVNNGHFTLWRRGQQRTTWLWHHQPNGHEFEQAPGVGDGQGSLYHNVLAKVKSK